MSLMSFSTQVWSVDGPLGDYFHHSSRSRRWLEDLAKLIVPLDPTEEKITSTLSQLSAAVSSGRALSAKIKPIEPYSVSQKLAELDPDILHMRHMLELGYSTYAVTEIISSMITHKLDVLILSIESLVGVVDFNRDLLYGKGKAE